MASVILAPSSFAEYGGPRKDEMLQFYPQEPAAMGAIFFHEIAHVLGVPHANETAFVPNCVCDMSLSRNHSKDGCLAIPYALNHNATSPQGLRRRLHRAATGESAGQTALLGRGPSSLAESLHLRQWSRRGGRGLRLRVGEGLRGVELRACSLSTPGSAVAPGEAALSYVGKGKRLHSGDLMGSSA